MDIKNKILNLAAPLVKAQGLEIWGLDLLPASGNLVRLFVEAPLDSLMAWKAGPDAAAAPPSATIDQCEDISRQLGLALDVEDCFPGPWTLEVSTPGLERKFFAPEQLGPYVGDLVEARLSHGLPGSQPERKVWQGRLISADASGFTIAPQERSADGNFIDAQLPPLAIPWEQTRGVSRLHEFNNPARPGKKQAHGKKRN